MHVQSCHPSAKLSEGMPPFSQCRLSPYRVLQASWDTGIFCHLALDLTHPHTLAPMLLPDHAGHTPTSGLWTCWFLHIESSPPRALNGSLPSLPNCHLTKTVLNIWQHSISLPSYCSTLLHSSFQFIITQHIIYMFIYCNLPLSPESGQYCIQGIFKTGPDE